jgi:hypothetical protein
MPRQPLDSKLPRLQEAQATPDQAGTRRLSGRSGKPSHPSADVNVEKRGRRSANTLPNSRRHFSEVDAAFNIR